MPDTGQIENGIFKDKTGVKLNKGDRLILPPKEILPQLYIAGGFFSNEQVRIKLEKVVSENQLKEELSKKEKQIQEYEKILKEKGIEYKVGEDKKLSNHDDHLAQEVEDNTAENTTKETQEASAQTQDNSIKTDDDTAVTMQSDEERQQQALKNLTEQQDIEFSFIDNEVKYYGAEYYGIDVNFDPADYSGDDSVAYQKDDVESQTETYDDEDFNGNISNYNNIDTPEEEPEQDIDDDNENKSAKKDKTKKKRKRTNMF